MALDERFECREDGLRARLNERRRVVNGQRTTVAELVAVEWLRPGPVVGVARRA